MAPKYSIYEVVAYKGHVYEIRHIYPMDWFYKEIFVYGLVKYGTSPSEPIEPKMLIVREGLLTKATDKDILVWGILYGQK